MSRAICRDLKINESDNLAISSQRYIEDPKCKKSLNDFINFLSDELTCTEVSRSQEIIASFDKKEVSEYYGKGTYSSSDVLDLLVKGKLNRQFMGHKNYCVLRKKKVEEVKTLLKNKDIIIIQSKLGNGKTVFLDCIAKEISSEYNVFVVNDLNNYIDDITYVQGLINKHNVLLIDDYGYFIPLLKSLGKDFPENLKIIMTCRTSININLYISIHKAQGLEYDSVKIIITEEVDRMITHNIFYTAITRSKKNLKIYWSPETQEKVINNFEITNAKGDSTIFAAQTHKKMMKIKE